MQELLLKCNKCKDKSHERTTCSVQDGLFRHENYSLMMNDNG